jgi:pilus assembly protein CpaC
MLWPVLLFLSLPHARADVPLPCRTLHVGDSVVWDYQGMTTAATGDPSVADLLPLSTHGLLINAKAAGHTTIVVFDKAGRHAVRVLVVADGQQWQTAAARIQAEIGLPTVTARAVEDVIFLEGTVSTPLAAQRAEDIAEVYAPTVKNLVQVMPDVAGPSLAASYAALINETWTSRGITAQVMDPQTIALTGTYTPPFPASPPEASPEPDMTDALTGQAASSADSGDAVPPRRRPNTRAETSRARTVAAAPDALAGLLDSLPAALNVVDLIQIGDRPVQQILVRAKVIDIDRNSLSQIGIQWGTLALSDSKSGNQFTLEPQPILFGQSPSDLLTNPFTNGGGLKQLYPLAASLTALITENKARVLSEPSLLVRDGGEGDILVGGEIPVPVAQADNGYAGANISVEYKPYGVRLHVQPTIVAPGVIELTAAPEVSDLDYNNGVIFDGLSIPALTVRRATSTLQLHDGQTLVIGGLYSSSAQRQVQRIPLLSQIPVLGEFFKYAENRKEDSELLILLSVQIVAPDAPQIQPPPPGSAQNPDPGGQP